MSKRLVAYFSASCVTARVANQLAKISQADLYEIEPEVPYTKRDLNWMNPFSRSTREMKGRVPYPKIKEKTMNVEEYDQILLAFPIWWHKAPIIMNAFLEQFDLKGKTIVLFATSGGNGLGKSADELKTSVESSTIIKDGIMLNGDISETVAEKIKQIIL